MINARKMYALLVRAAFGVALVLVVAVGVTPNTFTWGS
jgi:hypothetical protein